MKRVREDLQTKNKKLKTLPLAELEALAGALLPVLLALFAARIAREQAFALQLFAQLGVELDERAGNAQLHRACLSVHAAAGHRGQHVEVGGGFAGNQRLPRFAALGLSYKIFIEGPAVDGEFAAAGAQENPRHTRLAASRAVILNYFCHFFVCFLFCFGAPHLRVFRRCGSFKTLTSPAPASPASAPGADAGRRDTPSA